MKALFWSAVINGVVAVPLMVVIIVLASKKSVMGAYTASRTLDRAGLDRHRDHGRGRRVDVPAAVSRDAGLFTRRGDRVKNDFQQIGRSSPRRKNEEEWPECFSPPIRISGTRAP